MAVKILHKRSAVQFKSATGAQLELGELGLNYHESGPYLQCKDAAGEIVQLGGVYVGAAAPGNELQGAWWLRDSDNTLFLFDGTSWVSIAGGGGGGGGTTTVIGSDGIEAITVGDVVTVSVDLATNSHGLSIVGGKLQADIATASTLGTVKIGDGIDVDAAGEISVDLSGVDVNADLEYVPDGNNNATITNTAGDDATVPIAVQADSDAIPAVAGVAGLFTGLEKEKLDGIEAGAQANVNADWDATSGDAEILNKPTLFTEADADGRYLRIDADAPDQTRAAGKVTFSNQTTHEQGITVKGGSALVDYGIFKGGDDFRISSGGSVAVSVRDTGNIGIPTVNNRFRMNIAGTIPAAANNTQEIAGININPSISVGDYAGVNVLPAGTGSYKGVRIQDATIDSGAEAYGIYSNVITQTDRTKYNFYAAGTAPNFFQGITEHASGVKVTGGGQNGVFNGVRSTTGTNNIRLVSNQTDIFIGEVEVINSNVSNVHFALGQDPTSGSLSANNQYGIRLFGTSGTGPGTQVNYHGTQSRTQGSPSGKLQAFDISIFGNDRTSPYTTDFIGGVIVNSVNPGVNQTVNRFAAFSNDANIGFLEPASTNYGYYSKINLSSTGKTNYNFYAAGSAPNHFAGNTRISSSLDQNHSDTNGSIQIGNNGWINMRRAGTNTDAAGIAVIRSSIGSTGSWKAIEMENHDGSAKGFIRINGSNARVIDTRLGATGVAMADGAADIVKLLQPKVITQGGETFNGFLPTDLAGTFAAAVDGTAGATTAIGTYTNPEGVEETDVPEPEAIPFGATWVQTGIRDEMQGVCREELIPLLTKALQEALERIEALEAQLNP